ncbi:MAG: hypothetical protein ABIJ48_02505 [Actinomycetota bacterium]
MWWLLVIPGVALGGLGLHRLALWAESRGWIYYGTHRMPSGAAGLAMMEVAAIVEPQTEHVIEALRSEAIRAEEDASGEGREPGAGG